ncbi:MAG: hypothetical protein V7637_4757 [Mycobacteriales bacterium]
MAPIRDQRPRDGDRRWDRSRAGTGRLAGTPGLAVVVVAGGLTVLAAPGTSYADPAAAATKRVELGVFGDSYASGAGTDKPTANYATRTVASSGRPVTYTDPAHQSTRAPAWQAVDRVRRAHPDLDVHVAFDPVLGTTTGSFRTTVRPGTAFEHPAQLGETAGKDVVLLSIGGDEADLGGFARIAAEAQEDTTLGAFPGLLARLRDPAFARRLQLTYQAVLATMAPGGTLIVTTYPVILPESVPPAAATGSAGWVITTREARLANDYVRTLDAVITRAAAAVATPAGHQGKHVDTVDLRDAFAQHLLFSVRPAVRGLLSLTDGTFVLDSFHPNDLGQQIIGQRLQPVLDRAVARAAAGRGGQPAAAAPSRRPGVPADPGRSTPGGRGSAAQPPATGPGRGPARPVGTSAGPPRGSGSHPIPAGSTPPARTPPAAGGSAPPAGNPISHPPASNSPAGNPPAGNPPAGNPPGGSTGVSGKPAPGGSTPGTGSQSPGGAGQAPGTGSHPPAPTTPAPATGPAASSGGSGDAADAADADPGAAESSTDDAVATESDPDTATTTDATAGTDAAGTDAAGTDAADSADGDGTGDSGDGSGDSGDGSGDSGDGGDGGGGDGGGGDGGGGDGD